MLVERLTFIEDKTGLAPEPVWVVWKAHVWRFSLFLDVTQRCLLVADVSVQMVCSETSLTNYQTTLRNAAENCNHTSFNI